MTCIKNLELYVTIERCEKVIIWFFTIPSWILVIGIVFFMVFVKAVGPLVINTLNIILTIVIFVSIPLFWLGLITLIKGDYEKGEGGGYFAMTLFFGCIAFFGTNLLLTLAIG